MKRSTKPTWETMTGGYVSTFEDIARRYPPTTEDSWHFVTLVQRGTPLLEVAKDVQDGICELAEKVGSCFADGTLQWWPSAVGMDGMREIRIRWMRRRVK